MRRKARNPSPSMVPIDLDAALSCFDRPEVAAVYLFGSMAEGRETPLSDVDLAYLGTDRDVEDQVFDELYECLQRRLGEGNFDLVPLRHAPIHIQFQVATAGKLLQCRDAVAVEGFSARAIARHLDFKPVRDAYFAAGD